ncbi:hypothetical protein DWZ60_14900 [Blautia sp. AF34-10]|nr:hypothetical protein DWZ60_14900 [Blautia sp. AF34-10]RHS48658.1 hypothetical protein DW965_03725 [Blautia sp. AM47-4]RHU39817.1 hypothetical protein DXD21_02030 [Blautia sp. TF12-12AT]RHV77283.1 hypothetical protein DXB02_13525 [Blautia sp. OF11-22]
MKRKQKRKNNFTRRKAGKTQVFKKNECLRFFRPRNFFGGTRRKRGKMPRIFLLNGKKAKRLLRFVRCKEISC